MKAVVYQVRPGFAVTSASSRTCWNSMTVRALSLLRDGPACLKAVLAP